jgi:hypothetical protein
MFRFSLLRIPGQLSACKRNGIYREAMARGALLRFNRRNLKTLHVGEWEVDSVLQRQEW